MEGGWWGDGGTTVGEGGTRATSWGLASVPFVAHFPASALLSSSNRCPEMAGHYLAAPVLPGRHATWRCQRAAGKAPSGAPCL